MSLSFEPKDDIIYRVIGIKPNHESGNPKVKVGMVNSSRHFSCFLGEIYEKDWLKHFSKEDCTYLATLYTASQKADLEIIKYFPRKNTKVTINVLILAILYTGFLILSNVAGAKVIDIWSFTIPAVLIFFPFTYILDDILTEVYGFKVSRNVILTALLANIVVIVGAIGVVKLQPSSHWESQSAFETVFLASPRIFLASIVAYIFGEFLNAFLLSKMKTYTKGKYLWLRSLASTSVGAIFDSILFCTIAFFSILPVEVIVYMIISQYFCKMIYAFLALPVIYRVTRYLKKHDRVDTYDFSNKLNPFSMK